MVNKTYCKLKTHLLNILNTYKSYWKMKVIIQLNFYIVIRNINERLYLKTYNI